MGLGPVWQPPTVAKSWPGAAGRDESSLRFEPECRCLRQSDGRSVHLVLHQPNHPKCKLPRQWRLKSSKLLQETFEQGRSFAGRLMVMWLREGDDASLRLGVAAGRTIGGAVQRNRAKRRLREAFRLNRHRLQGKCDIVLMARVRLNAASWDEVQSELIDLAGKAGILSKDPK